MRPALRCVPCGRTVVGFRGRVRLAGETALDEITRNTKNTLTLLKRHVGGTASSVFEDDALATPVELQDVEGSLAYNVEYSGQTLALRVEQAVALMLRRLWLYALRTQPGDVVATALPVPVVFREAERHAMKLAAAVARLPNPRLISTGHALLAAYCHTRALPVEPVTVAIVDCGHVYSTVLVARVAAAGATVLSECAAQCGGSWVDRALLADVCSAIRERGVDVSANPRARLRTALQCERLKISLSTLREAELTIDSVLDGADYHGRLQRAAVERAAGPLLDRTAALVQEALRAAGATGSVDLADVAGPSLFAVEVVGGTARMPAMKETLERCFGHELSFTMDGSLAAAMGAALAVRPLVAPAAAPAGTVPISGWTEMDVALAPDDPLVARLVAAEEAMEATDALEEQAGVARNELESLLFDWRSALNGALAAAVSAEDKAAALRACDETDAAIADAPPDVTAQHWIELRARFTDSLPAAVREARAKQLQAEAEQRAREEAATAARIAQEQAARADRLAVAGRLKDKGNSLYRAGQYDEAREAYIKALNGFLGVEFGDRKEEAEANAVKVQCYLNLALCAQKLQQPEEAVRACTKAIELDEQNAKAYFRRAQAYLSQKHTDKAQADLATADRLTPSNPEVQALMKQVQQMQLAEKQREKEMFKRMFGGGTQ